MVRIDERQLAVPPGIVCSTRFPLDTIVHFRNTGGGGDTVKIISASVIGSSSFSVGNVVGRRIAPTILQSIPIRFAPTLAGAESGMLEIVISPCNDTLRLPLSAIMFAPRLLPYFLLDFGDVIVGASAKRTMVIRNTLPEPVVLGLIGGLTDPSMVLLTSRPSLPATLKPGDSVELEFEFRPGRAGVYDPTVEAIVTDPCRDTLVLSLAGRGMPVGDSLVLCIAGGKGKSISRSLVPFIISAPEVTLSSSIDIEYRIVYDKKLLQLRTIISTNSINVIDSGAATGVLRLTEHGVGERFD